VKHESCAERNHQVWIRTKCNHEVSLLYGTQKCLDEEEVGNWAMFVT